MFILAAVIIFVLAYILKIDHASVSTAFMPDSLLYLGLACVAMHLLWGSDWVSHWRNPR
jgi:hypothetical protein